MREIGSAHRKSPDSSAQALDPQFLDPAEMVFVVFPDKHPKSKRKSQRGNLQIILSFQTDQR
jgi:hypothetical protein